jgi:hypothetical protein
MLANRHKPIQGLMPEGRDNLKPSLPRIFKAFAHYSLVYLEQTDGSQMRRQFAKLTAVQQQILDVLGLPTPAEIFG